MRHFLIATILFGVVIPFSTTFGNYTLEGELCQWHTVSLTFDGPDSSELDPVNPFFDYRLEVKFIHDDREYLVPGFYAADGNAAETSADSGNKWRVRFTPDATGEWTFTVSFKKGQGIAIVDDASDGEALSPDGISGRFFIEPSEKSIPDHRARGRLDHVNKRYLKFAGSGEYFLKAGPDSPENLLAFKDFDGTYSHNPKKAYLKDWAPHLKHWREGDPTWQGGKGKALVGAMNYLGSQRMNVSYFLTMNIIGDGEDVWPYTNYEERYRFDVSKLAQWEILFSHMDTQGIVLHVVTQETENDQLLDGGELGPERKLYYRELIARFSHHPALIWNIGEENTNTTAQRKAFADYFKALDPYRHPTALHTYAYRYEEFYGPLLGHPTLDVLSFQTRDYYKFINSAASKWTQLSAAAGHPWVFFLDEPGIAWQGVEPDDHVPNNQAVMRKYALWGPLMGGGAGVEWYFGYELPNSDINAEDWSGRENMWAYSRHALDFFHQYLPFHDMQPANGLTSLPGDFVLAREKDIYAIYYPEWDNNLIDLRECPGRLRVRWYNPRTGDGPYTGDELRDLYPRRRVASLSFLDGGDWANLGPAPYDHHEDWIVLLNVVPQ